jgi:SAM-dependent methyltransferase
MSYLDAVPLNSNDISPQRLNIESKERSNLLTWNGQFSPQFVEELIRKYAAPSSRILDPFCGSGTVLYEAAALGHSATGIELNPAACALARTYELCHHAAGERENLLESVERKFKKTLGELWPEVATSGDDHSQKKTKILRLHADADGPEKLIVDALLVLGDYFKGFDDAKLGKVWKRLKRVIEELPAAVGVIRVEHGDGRYPTDSKKYDLVITSPPYINVYNYHQQYRSSVEALGWDLLEIAKTEIGSNRKNRGNRFLTVVQYCLDLATCFHSLRSIVSNSGRLIFVLGRESRVRGVPFLNGEIAAQLAIEAAGYRLALRQERVFTNRFGQRIFEDILHLDRPTQSFKKDFVGVARAVAEAHLRNGMQHDVDGDVQADIAQAIDRIALVSPSPKFEVL